MSLKALFEDEHFQEWVQSEFMDAVIKDIHESAEEQLLKAMIARGDERDRYCDQAGGITVVADFLGGLQEETKPEEEQK